MKISSYHNYYSKSALRRKPSPIRELQPLLKIPGMISLGGGNPTPALFPIAKLTFSLKSGKTFEMPSQLLEDSLQYSPSYGLPPLVSILKKMQEDEHTRKSEDFEVCVTTGSQDGLSKAFDTLIDEGDYVITENPTYSGSLGGLNAIGCKLAELARTLETWNFEEKKLRLLYLIPTGQNPSGSSLSTSRKKEIYDLARKYQLLILEDDPYYYLQLPTKESPKVERKPSFFSMDEDNRVIRFDSFSKIISSGLRLGFVSGPKDIVEKIQFAQQTSVLHVSGISQAILYTLLQDWGKSGFEDHILQVQKEYTKRRDTLISYADKYLTQYASWHIPSAGMFLWFDLAQSGIQDTTELIKKKAVNEKVLFVPGTAFSPSHSPSSFVRASYSTATSEEMEEAVKRFASLLKAEIESK